MLRETGPVRMDGGAVGAPASPGRGGRGGRFETGPLSFPLGGEGGAAFGLGVVPSSICAASAFETRLDPGLDSRGLRFENSSSLDVESRSLIVRSVRARAEGVVSREARPGPRAAKVDASHVHAPSANEPTDSSAATSRGSWAHQVLQNPTPTTSVFAPRKGEVLATRQGCNAKRTFAFRGSQLGCCRRSKFWPRNGRDINRCVTGNLQASRTHSVCPAPHRKRSRTASRPLHVGAVILCASLFLIGCNKEQKGSTLPSSANQPRYALDQPSKLREAQSQLDERDRAAREAFAKFGEYPGKLKPANHALAKEILQIAAEEGKSQDYAKAAYETELIAEYFDDEKQGFQQKVGGAAQYTAKQAGCKADVASATVHALNKHVEKSLEERLDRHSEAQRRIDENEKALGKDDRDALKERARELSRTSYLVYVAAPLAKAEIEAKLAEADQVASTLEESEEAYTKRSEDSSLDESERKLAQERAIEAREAKQLLETEKQAATEKLKTVDEQLKKLAEDYEQALQQLWTGLAGTPAS